MKLLGHRGDSARLPENTIPALRACLPGAPSGADGLELDVLLDAAGRPRVFHDDDTERLTGVPGRFTDHPVDRLDALRVGGHPIPHLADLRDLVLATRRPLTVNVELKTTPAPRQLVAACLPILAPLAAAPHIALIVSSFDPRVLYTARRRHAPWRLALLYEDPAALAALPLLDLAGLPVDLHPRHDLVDAALLEAYQRPGRAFRAWTVDAPAEAARLAALGIDAVITNAPAALRAALGELPADA